MKKTATIELGCGRVTIKQWGANQGSSNLIVIVRLLGGALAPIVAKGSLDGVDLGDVIRGLQTASLSDFAQLMRDLEKDSTVEMVISNAEGTRSATTSRPLDVDSDFAGEYGDLFKWFGEGVRLNYGNFFKSGTPSPASPVTGE